jgi:hypothetical protein
MSPFAIWPVTRSDDWCGEYREIDNAPPDAALVEAVDNERATITAWLREIENAHEVINLTMAATNGDVINAMRKCATMLEDGVHHRGAKPCTY